MTQDPLQVDLQDHDLLQEVELTVSLMVAANRSDVSLTTQQIDELLGLVTRPPRQPRSREATAEIA